VLENLGLPQKRELAFDNACNPEQNFVRVGRGTARSVVDD
jgi:hypothetical protein